MRRQVEWRDIDSMQHVNSTAYAAYVEEAGVQAPAAFGWSLTRLLEQGMAIFTQRSRIVYEQPALLGDELEIVTFLSDVKRTSGWRHYNVTRVDDGAMLARSVQRWAVIDLATGKLRRIPEEVMADLKGHIATDKA